MRILSQYVRDGAPVAVPLSVQCRSTTLMCRASSSFIFGRAKAEMLERMMSDHEKKKAPMVRRRRTKKEREREREIEGFC